MPSLQTTEEVSYPHGETHRYEDQLKEKLLNSASEALIVGQGADEVFLSE